MPDITLCTYTYNDAALALGLIASVPSWTLRPQRLLVVDDGSAQPFVLPEDTGGMAAELLRLPENQGPGKAKPAGISQANTELILSLDCDMRLAPGWLAEATPLALLPDVGIVGAPFVADAGSGVVGRWLKYFDEVKKPLGETDFLTGGIWLFRREVWLTAGGFRDYAGRTHEDHHFCGRVKQLGLRLLVTGEKARQIRRLSRIAMVKRFRTWFGPNQRSQEQSRETMEVGAMYLAQGMIQRLEYSLRLDEPLFVYFEMLLLAAFGAACYESLQATHPREAAAGTGTLLRGLVEICEPFPRLTDLLRRDLAALKLRPPETTEYCPDWESALDALATLARSGTFARIEKFLPLLLEEEGDRADFSFYAAEQ